MAGYNYDITINDYASAALAKISNQSVLTEKKVSRTMEKLRAGGQKAVPSIDSLRFKLQKLTAQRNQAFTTQEIRQFNTAIRQTERQMHKLEHLPPLSIRERFRSLGKSVAGSILPVGGLAAGVAGVGAALTSAIRTGADFTKEMSNVKALTGASGTAFENLNETARQLGASTAFSASQAAQGMGFLAQAGFKTHEIIEAMPATLNLAAAGGIELGQAADIASNVLSGFGLAARETERVANVMAKTASSANTNISEMGESMKFFAPTAKTLGINLEESSAAIGLLGNAGLKGSIATQALGTSLVRLTKPTQEMQEAMNKLKVDFFDAQGEFVGLGSMVGQLEGAFRGMTKEQQAANLSTLFGQEAFKNVAVLLDAGQQGIRDYTKELANARGEAQRMADTKLDNLAGDFTELKSALSEVSIKIFTKLAPALRSTVQFFTRIAQSGGAVAAFFQEYGILVAGGAAALGAYNLSLKATAIGTKLLTIWQKRQAIVSTLATAKTWALNAAMAANPVGVIVGGLAALSAAAVWAFQKVGWFRGAVLGAWEGLKAFGTIIKDMVITNIKRVISGLGALGSAIAHLFKGEFGAAKEAAVSGLEDLAEAAVNLSPAGGVVNVAKQGKKIGAAMAAGYNKGLAEIKTNKAKSKLSESTSSAQPDGNENLAKGLDVKNEFSGTLETNNDSIRETTETIVTGGRKQQIFNIRIDKVLENVTQEVTDGREAADDLVEMVLDRLVRKLGGTFRSLTT